MYINTNLHTQTCQLTTKYVYIRKEICIRIQFLHQINVIEVYYFQEGKDSIVWQKRHKKQSFFFFFDGAFFYQDGTHHLHHKAFTFSEAYGHPALKLYLIHLEKNTKATQSSEYVKICGNCSCTQEMQEFKKEYAISSFLLLGIHIQKKNILDSSKHWDKIEFFSVIFPGAVLSSKLLSVSLPEIKMSNYHFLQPTNLVCL